MWLEYILYVRILIVIDCVQFISAVELQLTR